MPIPNYSLFLFLPNQEIKFTKCLNPFLIKSFTLIVHKSIQILIKIQVNQFDYRKLGCCKTNLMSIYQTLCEFAVNNKFGFNQDLIV